MCPPEPCTPSPDRVGRGLTAEPPTCATTSPSRLPVTSMRLVPWSVVVSCATRSPDVGSPSTLPSTSSTTEADRDARSSSGASGMGSPSAAALATEPRPSRHVASASAATKGMKARRRPPGPNVALPMGKPPSGSVADPVRGLDGRSRDDPARIMHRQPSTALQDAAVDEDRIDVRRGRGPDDARLDVDDRREVEVGRPDAG